MNRELIPPNRRILLIDDNESIHQDFRKILNPAAAGKAALASAAAEIFGPATGNGGEPGYELDSAFQGQEGLEKVRQAYAEGRPYAMAFVDVRMPPGWDGVETISRIWSEYGGLQVVICTAYSDYTLDQMVGKLGRSDRLLILKKPFDAIEVLQMADALTEKWRLAEEARAKMEVLEERVAERTRELREEQQQLIEARKMELVGKLAGGIAHDFNSILTAIIGHADLIREGVEPGGQAFQSAVEIGKSAGQAATLTHQLLSFSRKQMLKLERLDVNAAVNGIGPELRELVGDEIEVSTSGAARNPWVVGDANQLGQVLISLAHNARDAMPRGGKLIVETADVTLDATHPCRDHESGPGDYAMISMTDTGKGISDEVKLHLFEPFFTTKAQGEGKGLGLAMCYGVLKQMGGCLCVESEAGRGATFKIYLPRAGAEAAAEEEAAVAISTVARGTEVILLVEENGALREMAAAVLQKQGYVVHQAVTGGEAVGCGARIPRVDLLIADALMPNLTGREIAEWVGASQPNLKVLFTSGREEDAAARGGGLAPGTYFLPKPYTPGTLLQMAREALDGDVVLAATGE